MGRSTVRALEPRLPVTDLAVSYRFYRDALGFASRQPEPSNADGFLIVYRDGFALQLVVAQGAGSLAPMTVWMQVGDAAAEHEQVRVLTPIEWGPEVYWYGCREFAVLDPDGHRIIFSSPTNDPPTCTDDEAWP